MFEILQLNFMQNALMAAFLVSIACGVIGSLVVVNRMGFIAGGIAHGAYGGVGIAFFAGISPLLGASLFSTLLALIIAYITLKNRANSDAVIGAIWAFGMAIGIVFIDLSTGYNADLMSFLFGSIIAVSGSDIVFMSVLDLFFIVLVVLFYRQFVAISFDIEFARLRGINTTLFYYVLIILMALCVVATIRVVGLILIIALLNLPPMIASRFTRSLGAMMLVASLLSMLFCIAGLALSFWLDLTSGASIILVASICYFISCLKR